MLIKLEYGIVIDNIDEDKKAKVKIRILPQLKDVEESLLPYAQPFLNDGMSTVQFSHNPPEIGSKIWVIVLDEFYKQCYYLSGRFFQGLFDITKVTTPLGGIAEIDIGETQDLKFKLLPDGSIMFWNTKTSNMGFYHKTGSYVVMNGEGKIIVKGSEIKIESTEDTIVEVAGDTSITTSGKTEIVSQGDTKIEATTGKVILKTIDSALWKPNILAVDPLTGLPHGGSPTINNLTGV